MGLTIEVTAFRDDGGPLTKKIYLNADGMVGNDSRQCFMSRGTAWRVELDSVQAVADFINKMPASEAYALGGLKDGHPDSVRVVTAAKAKNDPAVIARTKNSSPSWPASTASR